VNPEDVTIIGFTLKVCNVPGKSGRHDKKFV